MAVNKVIYDGNTLIDLTGDTVSADKLMAGETATDRSGTQITGNVVDSGHAWQDSSGYVHLDDSVGTKTDVSDTTATPSTVLDGEIFYTSAGTRSVGTVTVPTKLSDLTNDLVVSDFINDAGYLTSYTETDPVFVASAAHGITTTDIDHWDTGYIELDTTAVSGEDYELYSLISAYGWTDCIV